jgi:hypothetical protein
MLADTILRETGQHWFYVNWLVIGWHGFYSFLAHPEPGFYMET